MLMAILGTWLKAHYSVAIAKIVVPLVAILLFAGCAWGLWLESNTLARILLVTLGVDEAFGLVALALGGIPFLQLTLK